MYLWFSQKLSVAVSYEVVSYMQDFNTLPKKGSFNHKWVSEAFWALYACVECREGSAVCMWNMNTTARIVKIQETLYILLQISILSNFIYYV